ncbi:MAG TPA: cell division topological specificity factor MinE [Peptococcaceae bacterium]|nr:cell division topological specificity factor MinE [Bacillota bacterium]MDR9787589.1 cell division topological specificity factor MinE [Peptococcaceae bacterium MAG4]NLW38782.1 cell division topological specificity factor MinE [Peptococcaceae bacterium]HHU87114.1 cell division topological specificity factor MinE [Peptococcaceae bacterium]HPU35606.1 cell division topological specificity factor MinE [Bacillota bacterium]
MLEFLSRLFGRDSGSKNVAKERLRLVLVHDRSSVSPQLLETLKAEMIQVISNYMDVDEQGLEVNLDSSGNSVALVASIPVRGMKRKP